MTEKEAKNRAITLLLGSIANRFKWRLIEKLLKETHGNIPKALRLCNRIQVGHHNSPSWHLSNCGYTGPNDISYTTYGPIPNPIRVWYPSTSRTSEHDFTISWRDVFKFVITHGQANIPRQLQLFQEPHQ
jgi:hypothetical protein